MASLAWRESRRAAIVLLGWLLAFWMLGLVPTGPAVLGQEPEKPAAEPAPKQDNTRSESDKEPVSTNLFTHMVKSAWYFLPVFLVLSVALVFLIVLLAMDLRMAVAIPPSFVDEFTDMVNKRKFKEAYDMTRQESSFLARVLTTGMGRLQYGIEDARGAAMNMVETIKASKEQLITYLATIGTLGPLIGLVGTVFSMMRAFMLLTGEPNFRKLAGTLSEALVVTLIGIALSLPAIFCHAFFRNRLIHISMDTANVADDLLTQMYHNSKRPAPVGAPVAPPPAAIDPRSQAVKSAE